LKQEEENSITNLGLVQRKKKDVIFYPKNEEKNPKNITFIPTMISNSDSPSSSIFYHHLHKFII
jgi:hypothetical protein